MINDLSNFYNETVLANNENDAKRNPQLFITISKDLEVNWIYQ